jgi:hypothetical protein
MGRRSRKRTVAEPAAAQPRREPAPPTTPLRPRARLEEAPKAPWHPFPLVELAIFTGLVLVVAAIVVGGDARPVLLFGGLAVVSVAALELSIREHFAGYRSHTALLSALSALGVAVPLWYTPLPQEAILVVAVLVGAGAFRALRGAFAKKTGGLPWRA